VGLSEIVRAAGGAVTRSNGRGELEVLLVHRPRYDDWTLPKGKCAPGESDEDCALREVEEETGLRCVLRRELAGSSYVDSRDRPKAVRYWHMEPVGGSFSSTDEIDEVRWLPLGEADSLLSYARDAAVLGSLNMR
jgi:8-oxo-dGTP pyrophosphatase MutT (NUDIX family)